MTKLIILRGTGTGSEWKSWVNLVKFYLLRSLFGISWSSKCRLPVIVNLPKSGQIHDPSGYQNRLRKARLGQFGKVLSFFDFLLNSMKFDMSHANNCQCIQEWPNSSSPGAPGTGSWYPDVASMACYGPRWTHNEISWCLICRKARIRKIDLAAFIRITGIGSEFLAVSDVSDVTRVGHFTVVYQKYCKNKTCFHIFGRLFKAEKWKIQNGPDLAPRIPEYLRSKDRNPISSERSMFQTICQIQQALDSPIWLKFRWDMIFLMLRAPLGTRRVNRVFS